MWMRPIRILTADIQLSCISIQVSKWGNSLAIRLPADVVGALGLKEGDQIEVGVDVGTAGQPKFTIRRDPRVEEALAKMRQLRRPLRPGFKFDRQDANARTSKSKK
jgi:antitoxin MazE